MKKEKNKVWKTKVLFGIAAFLVFVMGTGILLGGNKAQVIHEEHFVAVEQSGSKVKEVWGIDPLLAEAPDGMLFAGWFTDASCETPVVEEEIDTGATYYAKYLDSGVLSIKLQLKSDETKNTTDMRVVSSVDGLNYSQVGFVVYFGEDAEKEEEPITFKTTAVQKRISASAAGVEYKFSPKVVNGDSEYFISGTVKGIVESKLSSYFYIKPYWTTLDGTTVYGENRYVSATNGLDADNLNVPIQVSSNPADADGNVKVTVSGKEVTAQVAAYKDGWAHLNVPVDAIPVGSSTVTDKSDLLAATKVALASDSSVFGVYRNYEGNGTSVDTSWYDVNPNAEEFVISTKADWEGLASVVNNGTDIFTGQTVILVKDLALSQGTVDAATGAWSGETVATTQVGKLAMTSYSNCTINTEKSLPFDGIFEGDGNTISGFYQKNGNDFKGLFTWVGENGILRNFKISNHYMGDSNAGWWLGSVASILSGSMDNVQADESVVVGGGKGYFAGGLVAGINGSVQHNITNCYFGGRVSIGLVCGGLVGVIVNGTDINIENCWSSGFVTATTSGAEKVGGFAGDVQNGTVSFKNCLNTGDLNSSGTNIGGFVGRHFTTISYVDCVSNGSVTSSQTTSVGSVTGGISGGQKAFVTNVYTTNQRTTTDATGFATDGDLLGFGYLISGSVTGLPVILSETELAGENGYINTELDFWTEENADGVWVATANGPELKQFSTAEAITDFGGVQRVSTGWYYEHYYNGEMADGQTYTIDTVDDLYGFSKMSKSDDFNLDTVKLAKTLDLNADWSASEGQTEDVHNWTPIGRTLAFNGTFEGNNQTISGLCSVSAEGKNGFFGHVGAEGIVQNLILENSLIRTEGNSSSANYTGGMIAFLEGDVSGLYAKEDVYLYNNQTYVGGIVGCWNGSGKISNSWFAGSITSDDQNHYGLAGGIVGGMLGNVSGGVIENCLNTGAISGNSWDTGGILGGILFDVSGVSFTIKSSLNMGTVTSTNNNAYFGAVIGALEGTSHTCSLEDVYTTTEAKLGSTVITTDMVGIGKIKTNTVYGIVHKLDEAQIQGSEAYFNTEFDFYATDHTDGIWAATASGAELKQFTSATVTDHLSGQRTFKEWYYQKYVNGVLPTAATLYTLDSAEEMFGFSELSETDNFSGDTVELVKSVDFNPDWTSTSGAVSGVIEWKPIGWITQFQGTFNGNNNTIRGICIDGGEKDANGLFGRVGSGGVVKNFQIQNSYIASNGVDGYGYWTAAVVGRFGGDSIDLVYVGTDVTIYSDQPSTGGIVGQWNSSGKISNCWFAGTVTSQMTNGNNFVGGIAGNMTGAVVGGCIENCLNSGTVTGNTWHGGGIVGGTTAEGVSVTLSHCLNTGTVMSLTNASYFGAIIGGLEKNNITCTLEDVYTTTEAVHEDETKTMSLAMVGISSISPSHADPDGTNRVYGVVQKYTSDYLAGTRAYLTTDFDFWSDSNTDGVWAATSSGPELKQFTTKTVVQNFTDFRDDTTWYKDICVNGTPNSTTLTITTAEQLYGFANLSQCYDFAGLTVKLGNDITVNATGTADSDKLQWYPIGRTHESTEAAKVVDGYRFAGTFDGNNKTIRGIYMKQGHTYMGLFAGTEYGSIVKNLRLKDSYFEQLYVDPRGTVGSIVADCRGDIDNVYSNATIVSNNYNAGGLVAWSNGVNYKTGNKTTINISNCWYDGAMTTGTNGKYVGGITSMLRRGTLNMENCLFSGTINSAFSNSSAEGTAGEAFVGGLFGTIALTDSTSGNLNTLNMDSCVSAGKITDSNSGRAVGAIGGKLQWTLSGDTLTSWTKLNMSNVFASRDCHANSVQFNWHRNSDDSSIMDDRIQIEGYVIWSHGQDRLLGYCTEPVKNEDGTVGIGAQLDFTNDWSIVCSGVPLPKKLEDVIPSTSLTDVDNLEYQVGLSYMGYQKLSDAVNMGMGNYVTTITSATYDAHYKGFITEMTTNRGYTVQSNNDAGAAVDGVYNTVLTKADGDWVINVTFVKNMSTLYLSVNTGGASSVSKHLNYNASDSTTNYLAEGTTTLTMAQLANNASGNQLFFQLPNGHFIVNDGAYVNDLQPMITKMKTLATEAGLDKVYIDAWILSHQHGDHTSILTQLATSPSYMSDVYVEGVYLSEPNDATFALEDTGYRKEYGSTGDAQLVPITDFRVSVEAQYAGIQKLKNAEGKQTPIYRFQTGQRYYFNGLTMDVIHTQEQMPLLDKSVWLCEGIFNSVSTTLVYTLSSGEKIFIAGDATHLDSDYIMEAYDSTYEVSSSDVLGSYNSLRVDPPITGANGAMKSSVILGGIDVFVLPHHGMNTLLPYAHYLVTETESKVDVGEFDVVLMPYNQNRMTVSLEHETEANKTDSGAYETQDYANEWVLNQMVPEGKMFHYQNGDVTVTFKDGTITTSGTPIARTGRWY